MPYTEAQLEDLTPQQLGMPKKFAAFRPIQHEMALHALYGLTGDPADARRFHCLGAPPGSGKSLATHYAGELLLRDLAERRETGKYAVLTATRSLEEQQMDDGFPLVNIKGRNNYTCLDKRNRDDKWTCDDGEENDCDHLGGPECTYSAWVDCAKSSRRIITNYQYWMNVRMNRAALEGEEGSCPIRALFCDEAHQIPSELSRRLSTWVSRWDLNHYARQPLREAFATSRGSEWGKVGERWLGVLATALGGIKADQNLILEEYEGRVWQAKRESKEYRRLDRLADNLERVVRLGNDNNWIWRYAGSGISFECIWPAKYAEWFLWSGVPLIVLMSATLRPKNISLCGIGKADSWFREWPRQFPPHLSPVYYVPACRMGDKQTEEQKMPAVRLLDEMADLWQGLNGIVHTPSYKLAEWIFRNSKHARKMVLNKPEDGSKGAVAAAKKYRETRGAILMSPSFTTGWDFPDEACEWQFIPKLFWPNKGDPVIAARMEDDKQYFNAETMQKLVQACFRGTRHEADRCTTVVSDMAVANFRWYAADHAPRWFRVADRARLPRPEDRRAA